jgi:hypothetical protein
MTFLNKIFNRSEALNTEQLPVAEHVPEQDGYPMEINHSPENLEKNMTNSINELSEDLFVDSTVPLSKHQTDHTGKAGNSTLSSFFAKDYRFMGQNDGFEFHTFETLSVAKSKIKSDFVFCVDQAIEERKSQKLEILNTLVKIGDLPEIKNLLTNQLQDLEERIATLKEQKELSVDNEGWVMKAIHAYHLGFVQGLNDWLASEGLLLPVSNI